MECNTCQEQMSLWIDDRLAHTQIGEIEAHAASCPACRASLEAMRRLDRLIGAAPVISPAVGFSARFQARLATRRLRRRTWAGLVTLTLATLILVLGAAILLAVSGLTLWASLPTSLLVPQTTSLLLDLGKTMVASLKLAWLIANALARGMQHPAFIAYVAATAILIAIWTQIIGRLVLVRRPISAN